MTESKRLQPILLFAFVALVVLNVWRWWPTPKTLPAKAAPVISFHIEDFEVRALPPDSLPPLLRDIFRPKRSAVKLVVKAVKPPVPMLPVKSAGELAHDAAQAEFSQIRCVGVSVRDQRIQAYLLNGGDPMLVSAGDKVGGRFVVEKIVPEGVILRDPETGVGGQISVSGK